MHQLRCGSICSTSSSPVLCSVLALRWTFIQSRRSISTSSPKERTQRCFYEVLGVRRDATQIEIKKAFYEKSKKLHPDLHESSNESTVAFVELKTAYDTLRRPADRRQYDLRGELASRGMHHNQGHAYHAYRPHARPDYYGGGGDWRAFWREHPGAAPGGEQNMSESEIFKRREEQWRFIMKVTILGAVLVIIYNVGYIVQLRMREHKLSQLVDSDEIAKCFLRQPEYRSRLNDSNEVADFGQMLKKDVDEAYRRRLEVLKETKNRDEIREEHRWMRAVEDAGRYERYRERRDARRAQMREAAEHAKTDEL